MEPIENQLAGNNSPLSGNGPAANMRGNLYTVVQAARILHLPVSWIYERTRKDSIPYKKMGKYIRFTDEDLQHMLAMFSRGPKQEETPVH